MIFMNWYGKEYFLTMDKNYLTRIDSIRFYTIIEIIQKLKPQVMLDAGCGSGSYLLYLANFVKKIYAIDFSYIGCRMAKDKTKQFDNVFVKRMDLTKKLRFPDSFFDFILCTEALEHIENISFSLSELRRILKPLGQILITIPNFTFMSVEWMRDRFFTKDPTHYHNYPLTKWKKLIGSFFKILKVKTITHYPTIIAFYLGIQKNILNTDRLSGKLPVINKMGRDILLLCQK